MLYFLAVQKGPNDPTVMAEESRAQFIELLLPLWNMLQLSNCVYTLGRVGHVSMTMRHKKQHHGMYE